MKDPLVNVSNVTAASSHLVTTADSCSNAATPTKVSTPVVPFTSPSVTAQEIQQVKSISVPYPHPHPHATIIRGVQMGQFFMKFLKIQFSVWDQ